MFDKIEGFLWDFVIEILNFVFVFLAKFLFALINVFTTMSNYFVTAHSLNDFIPGGSSIFSTINGVFMIIAIIIALIYFISQFIQNIGTDKDFQFSFINDALKIVIAVILFSMAPTLLMYISKMVNILASSLYYTIMNIGLQGTTFGNFMANPTAVSQPFSNFLKIWSNDPNMAMQYNFTDIGQIMAQGTSSPRINDIQASAVLAVPFLMPLLKMSLQLLMALAERFFKIIIGSIMLPFYLYLWGIKGSLYAERGKQKTLSLLADYIVTISVVFTTAICSVLIAWINNAIDTNPGMFVGTQTGFFSGEHGDKVLLSFIMVVIFYGGFVTIYRSIETTKSFITGMFGSYQDDMHGQNASLGALFTGGVGALGALTGATKLAGRGAKLGFESAKEAGINTPKKAGSLLSSAFGGGNASSASASIKPEISAINTPLSSIPNSISKEKSGVINAIPDNSDTTSIPTPTPTPISSSPISASTAIPTPKPSFLTNIKDNIKTNASEFYKNIDTGKEAFKHDGLSIAEGLEMATVGAIAHEAGGGYKSGISQMRSKSENARINKDNNSSNTSFVDSSLELLPTIKKDEKGIKQAIYHGKDTIKNKDNLIKNGYNYHKPEERQQFSLKENPTIGFWAKPLDNALNDYKTKENNSDKPFVTFNENDTKKAEMMKNNNKSKFNKFKPKQKTT